MDKVDKKAYTPKEFCKAYGICETVGYRWIHTEGFPKIVVGRRIIIPIEAVEKYMAQKLGKHINGFDYGYKSGGAIDGI